MAVDAIRRVTVIFSFLLSLISSLLALMSGGDIFFVIVERFFITFAASAFLIWSVLTVINSTIIGAAKESVEKLISENAKPQESVADSAQAIANVLREVQDSSSKGTNLDLTSEPEQDILSTANAGSDGVSPEIAEFEPFKPKRIDTDKDNVAQ